MIQNLPFGSFDCDAPAIENELTTFFFNPFFSFFLFILPIRLDCSKKNETTLIFFQTVAFIIVLFSSWKKEVLGFVHTTRLFASLSKQSFAALPNTMLLLKDASILCWTVFATKKCKKKNRCGRFHKKMRTTRILQ